MKDIGEKLKAAMSDEQAKDSKTAYYTMGTLAWLARSFGLLGKAHLEHEVQITALEARVKKLEAALAEALAPHGGLR